MDPAPPSVDPTVLPDERSWRDWRPGRGTLLLLAVPPLLILAALVVLLVSVDVPRPETLANPQVSVITYADGSELGRVGAQNRVEVPLSQVSGDAQRAVLAAEDRDFYSEPGISPKGIVRAAWANVRGGGVKQGASTITQQYAKNAYLTRERTWTRKLKEVAIAVKLERSYTKDEVLEFYLNTVYFGRGAYGIEVAAQTYFGKPAAQLTAAEGAVLAALLRSPSAYDPVDDPQDARERWDYVIAGMEDEGWLEQAPAYPAVLPKAEGDSLAGPEGYLVRHVQDELESLGFSEAQIRSGGLTVVSTIDRRAQGAAVEAMHGVTGPTLPDGVHRALVAVEPGTGRITAEYAGTDYVARPFNAATQGIAQAGSSFKPYVLAAALDQRMSLQSKHNGASPQTFGDYEVRNYGDEQFAEIDLVAATAHSVNTVFVPLGQQAGLHHVAEVARRLGVTADMSKEDDLPSFPLGVTAVTPLEQASAYATLAARGTSAKPFIVEQVKDADGRVVHAARAQTGQALPQGVADDTTHALQAVVTGGTGRGAQLPGRPSAGKTGTTSGNTAAWFVGYTPQLATAVALFSERPDVPLRGIAGVGEVTGGSLPARTWSRFMAAALEGEPVLPFAPAVFGGTPPSPSPSPSASPSASPSPSPSTSPSPSPVPSPTSAAPSPSPSATRSSPSPSPSATTKSASEPSPSPTGFSDG